MDDPDAYRPGAAVTHITMSDDDSADHDCAAHCACWCEPWIYDYNGRIIVLHRLAGDDDTEAPEISRYELC